MPTRMEWDCRTWVFQVFQVCSIFCFNGYFNFVRMLWECLVLRLHLRFAQIWIFFFVLLKLSAVCTFWIVLMCWCQKWFLKNKKTSLACISARKAIWKATATTLPNTLFKFLHFQVFLFSLWVFSGLFWKLILVLLYFEN